MYYKPRFSDGKLVPLSLIFRIYRRINIIRWPLEENVSRAAKLVDYFWALFVFIVFVVHEDAVIRYIRIHFSNIDEWPRTLSMLVFLYEVHLRTYYCFLTKTSFRHLLQEFYVKIYVSETKHPILSKMIAQQLRLARAVAITYIITYFGFFTIPIQNWLAHRKEHIILMTPAIDMSHLYIFIPFTILNIGFGFLLNSTTFGEMTLLAEILMHLNARFILLQQDLLVGVEDILRSCNPEIMARECQHILVQTLKKNAELNHFMEKVEKLFTFSLFVMFSFSATVLCILCYMVYTNPTDVTHILWFSAKSIDLLIIGNLGSTLKNTTNNISNMYYECNWEQVIYKSKNTTENVKLMKLIVLAIEINSKPMYLTGLKYFPIIVQSVLKIFQGAFSYFTFLTSINEK